MKYEKQAEEMHFFDFVFYEVKKGVMHIYCPNCGREHEIDIAPYGVKWIKEHATPCECFSFRQQPKFLHTAYRHNKVGTTVFCAEFQRLNESKVCVNVYQHKSSFDSREYGVTNPFYRKPIFSENKVSQITLTSDGKVDIKTKLSQYYNPYIGSGYYIRNEFRTLKKWDSDLLRFALIEESLVELKGTFLESITSYLYEFNTYLECLENISNRFLDEMNVVILTCLVKFPALVKLWKCGYKKIVFNKFFEFAFSKKYSNNGYIRRYLSKEYSFDNSRGVINYKAQQLAKILKTEPSKLDKFRERENLTIAELKVAQRLVKSNLELNSANVKIASASYFDELYAFITKYKISLAKALKYIRNQSKKGGDVTIYKDYLDMLEKTNTPITNDVVFPTSMTEAHDKLARAIKTAKDLIKNKKYRHAVKAMKAFEYKNDDYKIKVIRSASELFKYAQELHNCSARYVEKVISGKSIILLVIHNDTSDICMLEYDWDRNVVLQNYAIHNQQPQESEKQFVEQWIDYIARKQRRTNVA